MKGKIFTYLLYFLILFSPKLNAQLDLEHWFPPFLDSTVPPVGVKEIHLFLTTDKEEPFKVNLYNNNKIIKTFTLSKNAPVDYIVEDSNWLSIRVVKNTMTPTSLGLHLAGEKSFYATIKMAGDYISEMIVSKGKSALGNEFYVVNDQALVYDPNEPKGTLKFYMNYQASIMAFEDNTHIKVSGYDKRLKFTNGDTSDELNFTLNKGQSYIVSALKSDNPTNDPNRNPILDDYDPNFIGAKITSDKKIVITAGNFVSQDIGEIGYNINLDQTVPISKIGKEYFIANGLTYPNGVMEKMIMVATEDDTQIYLNDGKSPFLILNEGEYFIGPGTNLKYFQNSSQPSFKNSKTSLVETKGIFLKSSKPLYVNQLIGGFQDKPFKLEIEQTSRTGAMMFSFPLDQNYLPDSRQNLKNIVIIPEVDRANNISIDNKVTIKTEDGAVVKLNGSVIPSGEFSPIVGKQGWSYWSKFQNVGNLEITSNKSLNIDYTGGYKFSGLSGSYTGFSNDPFIIKNGNCIQESVTLSLNNTDFNKFQWQLNGVDIPGANSEIYEPTLPGKYTCVVSYMDFTFTTQEIEVTDCPYQLSDQNIGSVCSNTMHTPVFSSPHENLQVDLVEIMTQPLNGTVIIENGIFKIIPKKGFSGKDRFVYKITAPNGFYEIVKLNYTILPQPIANTKDKIYPKVTVEKNSFFDLTSAIAVSNNETFIFFESEESAINNSNPINDEKNYVTQIAKDIFIRVVNQHGCVEIKKVQLIIPITQQNVSIPNFLSPNGDGYNDVWDYSQLKEVNLQSLKIFNRQGVIVYEHQSGNYTWNGKDSLNRSLASDTYWVIFDYIDIDGNPKRISLWILLKNK